MLYGGPLYSSASDRHLNVLQVVENKCLRTILGKWVHEIFRKELYQQYAVTPLLHILYKKTQKFFDEEIKTSTLTRDIAPFIHQRILNNDQTS